MKRRVWATMHAVDRVSTRLMHLYLRAAAEEPDLGIASFTQRLAQEAWAHGIKVPRHIRLRHLSTPSKSGAETTVVLDGRVVLLYGTDRGTTRLITVVEYEEEEAATVRRACQAFPAQQTRRSA